MQCTSLQLPAKLGFRPGGNMDPAMFSVASMFGSDSGDEEDDAFVERDHTFPGLVLRIREFTFHQVNANLLWPGASIFAKWIVDHKELFCGRRVLELGSGTGALAIFLKKNLELDITTSDYDDVDIVDNIRKNCQLNGLECLPHIRHTWGEDFPYGTPDWDLIIASDILLYVKQYPNLIQTLSYLLKGYKHRTEQYKRHDARGSELLPSDIGIDHRSSSSESRSVVPSSDSLGASGVGAESLPQTSILTSVQGVSRPAPCFLMSWRRRIPKQDEALFFEGCKSAGLDVIDLGSRIYCIHQPV